ncbi:MAG: hypothetical protein V3W04_12070 [Gammaproteobacteria bacterium]
MVSAFITAVDTTETIKDTVIMGIIVDMTADTVNTMETIGIDMVTL